MATEYQWNAALSWPLNPSGHFTNHTGHTNASHISSAALVYVPGKMPPPWPYLVASAAISWLLAVIAWTTESIRDLNAPKKPSVLRHARQPSIIYSALRTLSLVITSARAPATRTIPSSFTTAAVAFSLISNLLDWEDVFDMYSWVVMVCTTTLFGLLAYEYSLTLPLLQSRDAASSYGSGRMALVGGACIRQLQRGETCKALQMLGCAEGGVGAGFVLHTVAVSYTQYWAQFVGVIGIVVALFYFAKFYMRRDDKDNGSYTLVFKCLSCVMLTIITLGLAVLAFGGGTDYVDEMATNGTGWTDCFHASEPADRYAFASLWFRQEWNKTVTEKLALLGFT